MREITHRRDEYGNMKQVVSADRLREILQRDGETLDRPDDFGPEDEWNIGDAE